MISAHDSTDLGSFWRALAFPFRLECLLFVGLSSVLLGLFTGGGLIRLVLTLAGTWIMLVWVTQYALQMIDDVANGERRPRAAAVELITSFDDARAWIHPALGVAAMLWLMLHPELPRWPVLLVAAVLFPASIGACAISGRALDAVNPVAMATMMRGLGPWYPLLVLLAAGAALLALAVTARSSSQILNVAVIEMLLLMVYAAIGGALFLRRERLDFAPRHAPERAEEQAESARVAQRQRCIDGLYADLRVRESARALTSATRWLQATDAQHLQGDLQALLDAGARWNEPREYPRLLRGLVPVLTGRRQTALALTVSEVALKLWPGFSPETEADTTTLVTYALQTGRRREATRLLDNFLQRTGNTVHGAELLALRARLGEPPLP